MFRIALFTSMLIGFFISAYAFAEPAHWLAKKGAIEYTLIGSVHVGDESMYPLPSTVTQYLAESDGLIIEANVTGNESVRYPRSMFITKDVLSRSQRSRLTTIANMLALSEHDLLHAPPWLTTMKLQFAFLSQLGYQAKFGVDMYLIDLAKRHNLPLLPLESVQFQIDLIAGQAEGGKAELISTLSEFDKGEQVLRCIFNSWKSGDLATMQAISESETFSEEYAQAFLYSRNQDWAEKLDSGSILPHKSGKYTVVVGGLHMVGRENLLELLEQRGFVITPLAKTAPANCDI